MKQSFAFRSFRRTGAVMILVAALGAAACSDDPGEADAAPGGADAAVGDAAPEVDAGGGEVDAAAPVSLGQLELVGHSDLDAYGDHAGLTVVGHHAYVGRRGQGFVEVVDIADPAHPTKVGELTVTSLPFGARELRAVPDRGLLFVSDEMAIYAYDISDPLHATVLGSFDAYLHEFFLWRDPARPDRLLIYGGSFGSGPFDMIVIDATDPAAMREVARYSPGYTVHSVSLTSDGRTAHLSLPGLGYLALDVGDFADALTAPQFRPITPEPVAYDRTFGLMTHSAVQVPGRELVVVTEEDYCHPFGGLHVLDVSQPAAPVRLGGVHIDVPEPAFCMAYVATPHNPTTTANLALVSWYDEGLVVLDLETPSQPTELARYLPTPLPQTVTQDFGQVAFWSYPFVADGLIYVVDSRNGFYVLRYTGPHQEELAVPRLEGNSSL
jgi:hypothetical protein